jgi:Holliday junction DNA helicase RuvB
MTERIISSDKLEIEEDAVVLRPNFLSEFVGQKQATDNLEIFIKSAKERSEPLDHVIFYGPPGLGKTTLAQVIAKEMRVNFRSTSGPILTKAGDLAAILTNLEKNDILFIDEIHRLNTSVEEILYSAMEDYQIDIIIGEGPSARTVKIELPTFTLIGATTRIGLLSAPLRDRFGIPIRLNFYNIEDLQRVIKRAAKIINIAIDDSGAREIAQRSRGTPRIALRLLNRVRDFVVVSGEGTINCENARLSLTRLEVDTLGLDGNDRRYIEFIIKYYNGGPVGIETICAGLSEQRDTIEETIEPYLIQVGVLQRTPRGRMLTSLAYDHCEVEANTNLNSQLGLNITE